MLKKLETEDIKIYKFVLCSTGISKETIDAVLAGMKSVTDEGGTASSVFKNFPIEVGGKTGSAETSSREGADVNAWFVGFAQKEDIKYYFAVHLGENNETNISGNDARGRESSLYVVRNNRT